MSLERTDCGKPEAQQILNGRRGCEGRETVEGQAAAGLATSLASSTLIEQSRYGRDNANVTNILVRTELDECIRWGN